MRNHQWVPAEVVAKISKLKGGQAFKILRKLLKNKFVVHTGKRYDGYKLAYLGYDYLALQTFIKRGILKDVIGKIGVGKQSDIYKCITPEGEQVVLKLTRLGRSSFRTIKKNRQYIGNRTSYNWLYLSRLSSVRQFLFMQLLYQNSFQTPKPIDTNRHAIVMSLVEGDSLCHIQRISTQQQIKRLFEAARTMLIKFVQNGLIHGDYNEFNLITNQQGTKLTVIDFPQCISINHPNAQELFNRDVECIYKYFDKMVERELSDKNELEVEKEEGEIQSIKKDKFVLNVADYPLPILSEIQTVRRLDREIKTKGHITLTEQKQLEDALRLEKENQNSENEDNESENEEQNSNESEESEENEQEQDEKEQFFNQQISTGRQVKKMSFDLTQEIEPVGTNEKISEPFVQKQVYDQELQLLMSELGHTNLKEKSEEEQEQQQQPQRPQFKGLTAFQIRQRIKQQKRQQRQNRKKQMTEQQFIKHAVKKSTQNKKYGPGGNNIGNRGNKKKNKINTQAIKEGYDLY